MLTFIQRSGHEHYQITLSYSAISVITLGLLVRDIAINGRVRSQRGYQCGTCSPSYQGAQSSSPQRPSRPCPVGATGQATNGKKLATPIIAQRDTNSCHSLPFNAGDMAQCCTDLLRRARLYLRSQVAGFYQCCGRGQTSYAAEGSRNPSSL